MSQPPLPFAAAQLDDELEQAGVDILVVNSKHNLAYLLGGHRHHFFEAADAIGVSRYLPLLVYPRGRPEQAVYVATATKRTASPIGPWRVDRCGPAPFCRPPRARWTPWRWRSSTSGPLAARTAGLASKLISCRGTPDRR